LGQIGAHGRGPGQHGCASYPNEASVQIIRLFFSVGPPSPPSYGSWPRNARATDGLLAHRESPPTTQPAPRRGLRGGGGGVGAAAGGVGAGRQCPAGRHRPVGRHRRPGHPAAQGGGGGGQGDTGPTRVARAVELPGGLSRFQHQFHSVFLFSSSQPLGDNSVWHTYPSPVCMMVFQWEIKMVCPGIRPRCSSFESPFAPEIFFLNNPLM